MKPHELVMLGALATLVVLVVGVPVLRMAGLRSNALAA